MKGDFTRDSFDPLNGFTRVLKQQGRLDVDADTNEREAIQLRLLRAMAADLIGPHGGPEGAFKLMPIRGLAWDFAISPGSYYVDGWRIEAPAAASYRGGGAELPGQPYANPAQPAAKSHLAYLEVWERHLSAAEHDSALAVNDSRRIADVALGGQDSASRAQTVWALRLAELDSKDARALRKGSPDALLAKLMPAARGRLAARAKHPSAATGEDSHLNSSTSAYRGVENHLYRVEIHKGGTADEGASFVWSRENGSAVFAVAQIEDTEVRLMKPRSDARSGLQIGDIMSLEGAEQRLGQPASLFRIVRVDKNGVDLELDAAPTLSAQTGNLLLRRWDHRSSPAPAGAGQLVDHAIRIVEDVWIDLEAGISICFEPARADGAARYRPGDYWLIPARTAIGDILWPTDGKDVGLIPPHGIERRVAPLALIKFDHHGAVTIQREFRREFRTLAQPLP